MVEDGHYVPVRDGDSLVAPRTDTLPAVPSGAQEAGPPATPRESGDSLLNEPSGTGLTPPVPAGSGGGSGRPLHPMSLSGVPGSRLADVSSFSSTLTLLGIPVEFQDELTKIQFAKHALDAMIEETIRTKQPGDMALLMAAIDAIHQIARARGVPLIVNGGRS